MRGKQNFEKTCAIFYLRYISFKYGTIRALIDLRTVPFKYGTFGAYHPMEKYVGGVRIKVFWYVTLVRYGKFMKYAMFEF